jgi:transcriptional regulator with XRE-family HTH domain
MEQTQALLQTLKNALKARGLTYREVANTIDLSEASVKRLFSNGGSLTLERLEQICTLLGMEMAELVQQMSAERRQIRELTEAQERTLVTQPALLLVAYLVVNGYAFTDILDRFTFTEQELISHLVKLDRIKLVELLPNNRIRRLTSPHFSWRPNGPIESFFLKYLQQDFLDDAFSRKPEARHFLVGMLSPASNARIQQEFAELAALFNQLAQQDAYESPMKREHHCAVLAMRPWQAAFFEPLFRNKPGKK